MNIKKYNLNIRLAIGVHKEERYICFSKHQNCCHMMKIFPPQGLYQLCAHHSKSFFKKHFYLLFTFSILSSQAIFAQTRTVTGTVTDQDGTALQGVSVVPGGATRGVTSSADGRFSIALPENTRILSFSYVGYLSQDVVLNGEASITVAMKRDSGTMNDVVVIGYGTARRKDITGAVSSVKIENTALALLPNVNALEALKGTVPGLNIGPVTTAGGQPSMLIRGQRSISGTNDPLILLDGVIYLGSISDINPNDIASFDVLKDAISSAAYGSRSANGVIAITTKKGKLGKPVINFRANGGIQSWQNQPVMMKGEEWIIAVNDRNRYAPGTTSWLKEGEIANRNAGKETVWLDEATQRGVAQDYQVAVSGAVQNINYYLSTSYNDNKGIVVGDEFNRISVFGKINAKVTSWLELGVDANYSQRDYSGVAANIGAAQLMSPYGVMFRDDAGNLEKYPYTQSLINPLWGVQDGTITNKDITDNFRLNAYAVVRLPWIKGLSYRVNYLSNLDRRQAGSFTFENYYVREGAGIPGRYDPASIQSLLTNANGNIANITTRSYVWDNILNYQTRIQRHRIDLTAVATRDHRKIEDVNTTGSNFAPNGNTTLGFFGLSKAAVQRVILSNEERSNIGYMARASYSFDEKYFLNGIVRRDGASVFGEDNIWGNFASVGAAWMISNENFMKNIKPLSSFKLRANWGQVGNQGLSPYATLSQIQNSAAGNARYEFSNAPGLISYGLVQTTLGNPSLGWEKTESVNIGFESGWLNNRLFVDVDAYSSRTTDQIFVRVIPIFTGFNTQLASLGEVANKGLDVMVRTINIQKKDLNWSSALVFNINRNKLVHLYNEDKNGDGTEDDDIANNFFIGKSLDAIYGYEQDGIVQADDATYIAMTGAAPGAPKYKDLNNDKKIDPADRAIQGYRKENFRLSIANTVNYKRLELYVMVSGIFGGSNFYRQTNGAAYMTSGTGRFNDNTISKPYWTPENKSNVYPSAYFSGDSRFLGIQSRGFVRIQDVSLSYSFDTNWMKSAHINALRVFVGAKNLARFTDWVGGDPETGTTVQQNTFPVPTTLSFGVNLGF
jgi:TonB-linked SusC/RagA family outer membrane protein